MTSGAARRRPAAVIALLSDFGTVDPFVGVMKGVILGRSPDVAIVDLTHAIPPQGIAEGAFWLERCARWFPKGTVFVAVVDPGVGTARRPLVVDACSMMFVGPDNGLLAPALCDATRRAYRIDAEKLRLPEPSRTFHGRDVFAPVAAELAAGRIEPADVGDLVHDLVPTPLPSAVCSADHVEGTVVTIDRFGNLITNVGAELLGSFEHVHVEIGALELKLVATYGDVTSGDYAALVNSFGTVEVARRDGDASAGLGVERGARVVVRSSAPRPRN